jgi:chromosome partitioning protein
LARIIEKLATRHRYIVIDTAGHDHFLTRFAHSKADTLITPLNDSFVDLDVLATVDPDTLGVTGVSHYARIVEDARRERAARGRPEIDWIVLRNRLSMLASRNKRLVGQALSELSQRLGFRCIEGLAERVVFREFYLRGLTAFDDLDESTLGTRPTMSHVAAQMEVQNLLRALTANLTDDASAAAPANPTGEPSVAAQPTSNNEDAAEQGRAA